MGTVDVRAIEIQAAAIVESRALGVRQSEQTQQRKSEEEAGSGISSLFGSGPVVSGGQQLLREIDLEACA